MSKKQKRNSLSLLALVVLGVAVFSLAATRKTVTGKTDSHLDIRQDRTSIARKTNSADYLRRSVLRPQLAWNLNQLGDRLERPGKERLSIVGSVRWAAESSAFQIAAMGEFPDRLQLSLPIDGVARTVVFDKTELKSKSTLSAAEESLLETLVYDSPEHFFSTQMHGQATRFLGNRFRVDDGSAPDYKGPYYDIYQVADEIKTAAQPRLQPKFFYFNSDTLLLDRVVYETAGSGSPARIEVLLADWRTENGQAVPYRIERIENGKTAFVLSITSTTLGARANDSIF